MPSRAPCDRGHPSILHFRQAWWRRFLNHVSELSINSVPEDYVKKFQKRLDRGGGDLMKEVDVRALNMYGGGGDLQCSWMQPKDILSK